MHGIVRDDAGGVSRDKAKRQRRGKLLELLAFLGAPCVGQDQAPTTFFSMISAA